MPMIIKTGIKLGTNKENALSTYRGPDRKGINTPNTAIIKAIRNQVMLLEEPRCERMFSLHSFHITVLMSSIMVFLNKLQEHILETDFGFHDFVDFDSSGNQHRHQPRDLRA